MGFGVTTYIVTWGDMEWGRKVETDNAPGPIHVTTDSMMPAVTDNCETQQLNSPSQVLNTTTAMETLKHVDDVDKSREQEVQGWYNMYSMGIPKTDGL